MQLNDTGRDVLLVVKHPSCSLVAVTLLFLVSLYANELESSGLYT